MPWQSCRLRPFLVTGLVVTVGQMRACLVQYQAKSWDKPRKVAARLEASAQRLDVRYVVTSLPRQGAPPLQDRLLRTRSGREPDQAA